MDVDLWSDAVTSFLSIHYSRFTTPAWCAFGGVPQVGGIRVEDQGRSFKPRQLRRVGRRCPGGIALVLVQAGAPVTSRSQASSLGRCSLGYSGNLLQFVSLLSVHVCQVRRGGAISKASFPRRSRCTGWHSRSPQIFMPWPASSHSCCARRLHSCCASRLHSCCASRLHSCCASRLHQ